MKSMCIRRCDALPKTFQNNNENFKFVYASKEKMNTRFAKIDRANEMERERIEHESGKVLKKLKSSWSYVVI